MRSKVLAEGYFLRSGKRAEVTFVDFFRFDVEGEMTGEIALHRRRVVAQIAAVGFPLHHRVRVVDVGLVHALVFWLHPSATGAVGRSRREGAARSFVVLGVVLHMSHQGS